MMNPKTSIRAKVDAVKSMHAQKTIVLSRPPSTSPSKDAAVHSTIDDYAPFRLLCTKS